MSQLRIKVFRGFPKEIEEDIQKFLESVPCEIQHVLQSESNDHVTVTIFYIPDQEAL